MRTLRVMGIIGLCLSAISFIFMIAYDNSVDYEAAIGWGVILMFYTVALCIVAIVKGGKPKN
jgi:hypothetical protein